MKKYSCIRTSPEGKICSNDSVFFVEYLKIELSFLLHAFHDYLDLPASRLSVPVADNVLA